MAFLKVTGDKFQDKTTTQAKPIKYLNFSLFTKISLRHISCGSGNDYLLIDIFTDSTDDWLFIRSGNLYINLNNSINITLGAQENSTDCSVSNNVTHHYESVYYDISKEILAQICDADTVDLKLTGDNFSKVYSSDKFLNYCRRFYNEFYGGDYPVKLSFWSRLFG